MEDHAAPDTNEVSALIDQRRRHPGPAFVEGATGAERNWADVARRRDEWSAIGPRTGRVGLLIADPLEMAATFLAALARGVTVAPINPAATTPELLIAVRTLGVHAVVADGDLAERGAALSTIGVDVWEVGPAGLRPGVRAAGPSVAATGGGAALLMSSSGTTGTPKLIPLRLEALLHTARAVVDHHELRPDDRGYSPLPLFHINGLVVGVLGALVGGHRIIVDRRFAASTFWDVVERTGATWLNLVPAIISVLAVRAAPAASATAQVGFARSASAPLPQATRKRFEKVTGVGVLETYGMTEAGSQIAANPRSPSDRRPGSVGVPVGLELRVVDGSHHCLPPGVVGEVEIRGANVVSEYWAPAGTAGTARPACRPDGWLATGDLGRVDDDGYVYLAGRDDDVINRGGEKVYPREVEEVLFAEAGVTAAAVVGRPHPIVGEEPVAFVVAAPGTECTALEARLQARCETELSRFRRPAEILLVASLPSGLNGKVRRADLRALVCTPQGQRPSRPGPRPSPGHTPELAPVASRSGR